MYRISEVAQVIIDKKIHSVLDVGCRDTVLKQHLPSDLLYHGNDLFQNATNSVTYVGDILHADIPQNMYECVTALDILEHTDDPYSIFDKLSQISTRFLIINLPNCYDLKSIFKFVINGQLGGKYRFGVTNQLDRHRWLMNYGEIEQFYRHKAAELGYQVEIFPLYYGGPSMTLSAITGRILSAILPKRLVSSSVVGVFEKQPS